MKILIKSFLLSSAFLVFTSVVFSAVLQKEEAFTDVKNGDFAYYNINFLKSFGIINGYEDGSFKPNKKINRAEFLKIILEAASFRYFIDATIEGENCFPDVKNEWFAPYVCTAKTLGVIDGYPDGNFHPEQTINFVEAAKIISNTFQLEIDPQKYQENWYQPYVFALAKKKAIPDTVLGFEYPVTRADMACMVSSVISFSSSSCDSEVSYGELAGVEFIEDPIKLNSKEEIDVLFYKSHDKLYVVDYDGAVYQVNGANPDKFEKIAGSLYMDNQYIFNVTTPFSSPVEIDYIVKFDFDLSTLQRIKEGDNYDWFFLKDKNNLYTSCGYSEVDAYQTVDDFDVNNFKILVNNPNYTYFTDSKNIYKATHEKPDPDSKYYCKVEMMDNSFKNFDWIYPKSVQDGYNLGNAIAFVKDKENVYDLADLSILEWADVEAFNAWTIQYGGLMDKEGYYVTNKDQFWHVNPYTFELVENQEIDGETLDFVSIDYLTYYFDQGEVSNDFELSPGRCELMKSFFGKNTEIQYDNRTDILEIIDDKNCTLHRTEKIETQSYYTFLMKDKDNFWLLNPVTEEFEKVEGDIVGEPEEVREWQYDNGGFRELWVIEQNVAF